MLMTEPLAATLLAGAMLGIFWAGDGVALWRWAVPGLTLGALALVRPEYLAIGFLLAVLVLAHEHLKVRKQRLAEIAEARNGPPSWPRSLTVAAILVLGIVVVVAPVDGPQRVRPPPVRVRVDRRRPGPLRRHLPALGREPGKGRRRGGRRTPGALRPARGRKPPPRADPRPARRTQLPRDWNPTRRSRSSARRSWKTTSSTTPANTSASSPRRSAGSGPTAPAR